MRVMLGLLLVMGAGCFKAWDLGGPWACFDGGVCPQGYLCDDAVCCVPGGTPACPTLPTSTGRCLDGGAPTQFFRDRDQDGAGAAAEARQFCAAPVRETWVSVGDDCDDTDPAVGPRATERCNARDDDCDGELDDGLVRQSWFTDADHDGFGGTCETCRVEACAAPMGLVSRAGDCNDENADIYPGAPERCSNVDENCNGLPDDAPFLEVESPGSPVVASCQTGLPGACNAGGTQCVFNPVSQVFAPACVPKAVSSPDRCGDGVDSDCSGVADDRPGCGGPSSFLGTRGLTIGAVAFNRGLADPSLPSSCVRSVAGSAAMGWLSPNWLGNGENDAHVWFVEAPEGSWWDLSSARTLSLSMRVTHVGNPVGSPFPTLSPVVNLCGDTDADFARYEPTGVPGLQSGATNLYAVPLAGDGGWSRSTSSTFSLQKVKRVEVVVRPAAVVTYRITFAEDAGFR